MGPPLVLPEELPPGKCLFHPVGSSRHFLYAWMGWSCSAARMAAGGARQTAAMAGLASCSTRPCPDCQHCCRSQSFTLQVILTPHCCSLCTRLQALLPLSTLYIAGHPHSALLLALHLLQAPMPLSTLHCAGHPDPALTFCIRCLHCCRSQRSTTLNTMLTLHLQCRSS